MESKGTKTGSNFSQVEFESQPESQGLFNDASAEGRQTTYQLHNKYIISTIKSGMMILDQNRAHQRVLYEGLLRSLTVREAVSQQLLFPLQLQFSTSEMEVLQELKEDLEHTGFLFSEFVKGNVEITGVPINVAESEVAIILEQLLSDVQQEVPDTNFSAMDLMAKSMAKSLAIKTGQSLTRMEQEHLVNSLFACKEPSVSPTNRVTFITMSVDDFDKKFI
jgi:DNA mismatch repair protein MutL